jgi:hypothetical protein
MITHNSLVVNILLFVVVQRKEHFLLQMHLASMPALQKSDAELVEESKVIFEVSWKLLNKHIDLERRFGSQRFDWRLSVSE